MISETTTEAQLGVVIIAAGNSSRLGQPKQLISYKGIKLLSRTMQYATAISEHYICVLGSQATSISEQLNLDTSKVIVNPNWQVGMGSSIATGVTNLSNRTSQISMDGVLILLCDQYLLTKQDLQNFVSQWRMNQNQIAASHYFDKKTQNWVLGAPAIFPKKYFKELKMLSEKGAKAILEREKNKLQAVALDNAAFDLDTPKDLQQLQTSDVINMENSND